MSVLVEHREVVIYRKSINNVIYAGEGSRKLEGGNEEDQFGLTVSLVFSFAQKSLNILTKIKL